MTQGITITNAMILKPEERDKLLEELPVMLELTKTVEGFQAIKVVQHGEDPNRIVFIETWESEAAFRAYIAWRTERGDIQRISDALAGPREVNFWPTVIADVSV